MYLVVLIQLQSNLGDCEINCTKKQVVKMVKESENNPLMVSPNQIRVGQIYIDINDMIFKF